MAFKTNGGFGNCAVGQKGGAATGGAAATVNATAPAAGAGAACGKTGGEMGKNATAAASRSDRRAVVCHLISLSAPTY